MHSVNGAQFLNGTSLSFSFVCLAASVIFVPIIVLAHSQVCMHHYNHIRFILTS